MRFRIKLIFADTIGDMYILFFDAEGIGLFFTKIIRGIGSTHVF